MAALESALEQLRSGQPTRIAANRRSIRIEMNIFHRNHLHLFMSLLLLLLLLCVWFDVFGFLSPGPPCSVSVIVVDPFIISSGAREWRFEPISAAVADHHFRVEVFAVFVINH